MILKIDKDFVQTTSNTDIFNIICAQFQNDGNARVSTKGFFVTFTSADRIDLYSYMPEWVFHNCSKQFYMF